MQKYIELAEKMLNGNISIIGIRALCDDEQYEVGDKCRESYEWDIENDCSTYDTTGEKANGTCATHVDTNYFKTENHVIELAERIRTIQEKNRVYGKNQVVIAGERVNNDGYFDEGEIRIVNAYVLEVLSVG